MGSLTDRVSFRQKPTGVFKWILRVPVYLFRWNLGFLMGDRFVLITHEGRESGRTHQTPVEVVVHADGEYFVCSGTGPGAAQRLLKSMGNSYDGTDAGRVEMMADMPMVAFSEIETRS